MTQVAKTLLDEIQGVVGRRGMTVDDDLWRTVETGIGELGDRYAVHVDLMTAAGWSDPLRDVARLLAAVLAVRSKFHRIFHRSERQDEIDGLEELMGAPVDASLLSEETQRYLRALSSANAWLRTIHQIVDSEIICPAEQSPRVWVAKNADVLSRARAFAKAIGRLVSTSLTSVEQGTRGLLIGTLPALVRDLANGAIREPLWAALHRRVREQQRFERDEIEAPKCFCGVCGEQFESDPESPGRRRCKTCEKAHRSPSSDSKFCRYCGVSFVRPPDIAAGAFGRVNCCSAACIKALASRRVRHQRRS